MIFQGDKITTSTTIAETISQAASNELLEVQILEGRKNRMNYHKFSKDVSQSNTIRNVRNFTQIQQVVTYAQILPKSFKAEISNRAKRYEIKIIDSLQKIFFKKKRFIFQILKQFFLFPDDSESSIYTLSSYDPLILNDEIIHSLVKKLETKIIENKIWGFLNLRMRPYLKAAAQIERTYNKIHEKVVRIHKKASFDLIKQASEDFISYANNGNNLHLENKEMRYFVDEKKRQKAQLNSRIIQQKVLPSLPQSQSKIQLQSTTRVYTRQEYEKKYDRTFDDNSYGLNSRVVRMKVSEESKREPYQHHASSIFVHKTQKNQRPSNVSPVAIKHTSSNETGNKEFHQSKKGFNKYNIIHYHERPRQINQTVNKFQSHVSIKSNCLSSRCICHCCCFFCCEYSNNCCYANNRAQRNINSTTAINQKLKNTHVMRQMNSPQKINIKSNYELSELESRIQYLNFLRKVVNQQQAEQAIK